MAVTAPSERVTRSTATPSDSPTQPPKKLYVYTAKAKTFR